MQHQIPFKHIFWSNYHLSNFFWKSLMSNKSILERKSKYLNSMRVFPFFISFFCWNETTTKSSTKEDRRKMENCKADNITEKLFRSYWKESKLSLCKKHLYRDLYINSCSLDVSAIKNALLKHLQIYSRIPIVGAVQFFGMEIHP